MFPEEQDAVAPIAIVGMGCRFPGEATSPKAFFEMLSKGRAAWSEVPLDRYNMDRYWHPHNARAGTMTARGGHFLKEDLGLFDAPFFSLTAAEATALDPQLRILLEVSYECLENAGIPMEKIMASDTSCFIGCSSKDYDALQAREIDDTPLYQAIGGGYAMLSSRLSHFYSLTGPSMSLDTACSSGLVALHLGCQSIRNGESRMSLIGATQMILSPDMPASLSSMHMLSPDSRCYSFDERANGYARGEGICVMALKPLDDALRDGDTIRAIVRGTGTNQDGRTPGITVPNLNAQASMIKTVYEKAGLDFAHTQYFEAHGTGTPVGDPLELGALGVTFGKSQRAPGQPLYVGSVKTNIGHLEGCAGLAGLLKTILCLENGVIVPSLNYEKPNPKLRLEEWNLKVPTKTIAWPTDGLRRASVNSFGYGGSNAHCILDDAFHYLTQRGLVGYTATVPDPLLTPDSEGDADSGHGTMSGSPNSDSQKYFPEQTETHPRLFVLSSPEQGGLQRLASSLAQYISEKMASNSQGSENLLRHLSNTLATRRSLFQWRAAFHASSAEDLVTALTHRVQSGRFGKAPNIAFVFTGQGAQWHAMGRELMAYEIYSQTMHEADRILISLGADWSLLEEMAAPQGSSRVNMSQFSQPLCASLQLGLVNLLRHWGISPAAVCGHSSGEIAAAYAAGMLSMHDCLKVAYHRGRLSQNIKMIKPELDGAMLSVGLSEEKAQQYILKLAPSEVATIACINSPSNVTVSGDSLALTKLEGLLKLDDVFARRLKVENAYHSPHMQIIADDYLAAMGHLETREPSSSAPVMFSTVTGTQVSAADLDAAYWVRNMVSPVQFVRALDGIAPLNSGGRRRRRDLIIDTLLEIGPHGALQGPLKQILTANGRAADITYLALLHRSHSATETALDAAGKLWIKGQPLAFHKLNALDSRPSDAMTLTDLPNYTWNHTNKYWHETATSHNHRLNKLPRLDLLGKPVDDFNPHEALWKNVLRISELPWLSHHKMQDAILYPAAGMICAVLEAAKQLAAADKVVEGFEFRDIIFGRALIIPTDDKGIGMTLHVRPRKIGTKGTDASWLEFTVYSNPSVSEHIEHCSGLIQVQYESKEDREGGQNESTRDWDACRREYLECKGQCTDLETSEDFYAKLASRGMQYGPLFQPIKEVHIAKGTACCSLQITDTKVAMPAQFEYDHLLHPSTLDGIFQSFVAGATDCTQGMVPTAVGSMFVSADLPKGAGAEFRGFSKVNRKGFRNFVGPIYMSDEHWHEPKVVIKGIFCTELGALSGQSGSGDESSFVKKLCSQIIWKPDVNTISQKNVQQNFEIEHESAEEIAGRADDVTDFEKIARFYISRALTDLSLEDEATLAPHHAHFVQWARHRMLLTNSSADTAENDDELLNKIDSRGIDGPLLALIGSNLTAILKGAMTSSFEADRDGMLLEYQTHAVGLEKANHAARAWLDLQAHKRPDFDYLEIATGPSALTRPALEILGGKIGTSTPRFNQYTFSNSDEKTFEAVRTSLRPWQDKVRLKTLDIEQDPATQGLERESFDVIIASNILHTCKSVDKALAHCNSLLKPGGKLLLTEYTKDSDRLGLIMGTSPSWWRAEDGRVGGPLLDERDWHRHLSAHFSGIDLVVKDTADRNSHCASMMVTTKASLPRAFPFAKIVLLEAENPTAEASQFAEALAACLSKSNVDVEKMSVTLATAAQSDGTIYVSDKGMVSLLELEQPVVHDLNENDFEKLHKALLKSRGGLWISRAGLGVDPTSDPRFAATTGLLRTIRTEKPEIRMHQLDLSTKTSLSQPQTAELVVDSLRTEFTAEFLDAETEVAELNGQLYIPRLFDDKAKNYSLHMQGRKGTPELQPFVQPGRPLRLDVGVPGMLDSLHFVDDPRPFVPLGDHEVEFEVQASAVNFMDIMVSMGLVADTLLGVDAAGVVKRIGLAVSRVKIGDRVAGFGGYANLVHIDEGHVELLPDNMSVEEGASLPTIAATAYQSLIEIARLNKGETILIHSAAGGVGQIAIQIAKHIGAEVFATVGSSEKRRLITQTYGIPDDHIFNSRHLSFAKAIMRSTTGQGVDVVLNSLAGEALRQTWECIAPFGRFIEIGKKDILANGGLEMMPFLRNVTFAGVNLEHMSRNKPKMLARVLNKSFDLIRSGAVGLVNPTTVYKYSEIERVFRLMQQGKHTGKCVLKVHPDDFVPVIPRNPHPLVLRGDATYVLVGGLGGIGRSLAMMLAKHGAKHLAFLSRSGDAKPEAKKTISDLEKLGVRAIPFACDTVDTSALEATISEISTQMAPIKGLIQAAMVLNDTYFEDMTYAQWSSTTNPKIRGTWNLHNTLPRDLDFFVMLSSISGIVGNGSQANYAAGNTFQDGLAHYRRGQGLAACTLDLSVMAGIGWVAENVKVSAEHKADFERMAMEPEELYSLVASAITGYSEKETRMPAQMVTGAGTGGTVEAMEHLKTAIHFDEAMFSYLRRLDKHGAGSGGAEGGPQEIRSLLSAATSLVQAGEIVEVGLTGKLAKSLAMEAADIDTTKPVHGYGVDSLVAIEVRNWIFKELKSQVSVFDILSAVPMSQLAVKIAEKSTLVSPDVLKKAGKTD